MTSKQRETVNQCMAAIYMAAAILGGHPKLDAMSDTLIFYGEELKRMLKADEARAKATDEAAEARVKATDEAAEAISQAISVMMLAKGDFLAEGSLKRAGDLENAIEGLKKIL